MSVRFCLVVFLLFAAPVYAQTKTWDGGAGTNQWTDGDNWSPDGVPSASDDVVIDGGDVVELSVSATVQSLQLGPSNSSLTIASGQTLNTTNFALGNFGAPSLSGPGALVTDTLSFIAGKLEAGVTVTVSDSATVSGTSWARDIVGSTLVLNGPTAIDGFNPLRMSENAAVEIAPGVVVDLVSDGTIRLLVGEDNVINNAGTIRRTTATGTFGIQPKIANTGLLRVETGTLQFGGGGTVSGGVSPGDFEIAADATLDFEAGTFDFTGADFEGEGTLEFGRVGNVTLSGLYDMGSGTTRVSGAGPTDSLAFGPAMTLTSLGQTVEMTSGSGRLHLGPAPDEMPAELAINGGSIFSNTSALTLQSLSIGNTGASVLAGTGDITTETLSLTAGLISNDPTSELRRTVIVNGEATISGTSWARDLLNVVLVLNGPTTVGGANPLRMRPGATLVIGPDGVFELESDGAIAQLDGAPEPEIINAGVLRKADGTTESIVRVDIVNRGTIDIPALELRLERGLSNEAEGVVTGSGTLDLTNGLVTVTNAGAFAPGGTPGVLTYLGDFDMTAETAVLDVEIGGATAGTEFDQLAVTGTATLDGTLRASFSDFTPSVGDRFLALAATEGVTGAFDAVETPDGIEATVETSAAGAELVITAVVSSESGAEDAGVPDALALHAAYPNPFADQTTLQFDLPETARVHLVVYDVLGREVATLVDGDRPAGVHTAQLRGSGLASGLYVVRFTADERTFTRRVMLAR